MSRGRKPKSDAIRRGVNPSLVKAETIRGVTMPEDIAADPVRSVIWTQIAPTINTFLDQDIPVLRELVYWHAVYEQAASSILFPDGSGRVQIYEQVGERKDADGKLHKLVKPNPAIAVMKNASSEIRALSDQLGLSPLARSRIGLMQTTTVKTAAETARMFRDIDEAY